MTKYHAVREQLLDRLDQMAAGEQLPPERELSASLGVSRMTLRRAIDDLVARGAVRRRQGSGVFALGPKLDTGLVATSFTADMRSRGLRPGARTLAFERRPAGARVGRRLRISPTAGVVRVTRLRLADGEPMAIEQLHVPDALVPGLGAADLQDASFYDLLRTRYGVTVVRGVQTIEPTVLDGDESASLDVPVHSPALQFERTSWGERGAADGDVGIVEFVRSVYRGDRYQIRTELSVPSASSTPPGGGTEGAA
ncbi:GntR family transcriptional regulator [Isoptericola sp. BMS4]|uniref:GntR family transcriptional regulator n=1 Tax=Isoptericola sp. BMS4 TaxID=2527875 RepID=UPI0014245B58|nr:GntR family transcriptional regulator [Isoptericola sp. BMS4]